MASIAVDILSGNAHLIEPLVSICIPNYNGAEYIEECIGSVLSQEQNYAIEIIVHDDASTDESLEVLRSHFPQVEVLASRKNVGFCISNNRMVTHSRGKYVLLLNNDAVLRPGSLKAFMDYTATQATQGILGLPQYTLYDGSLVDRGYEFDLFMNPIPVFSEGPTEVGAVTGACLWIPRNLWDTIGGFPPWFESVAEDIFLCCAARLLGHPVTILKEPGFDHWIGKNLGGGKIIDNKLSSTVRRRSLTERNKTWVMMMCYPLPVLLILLPVHFLFLGLEGLVMLLMKRDLRTVDAIYAKLPKRLIEFKENVSALRSKLQFQKRCRIGVYFSKYKIIPWKLVMLFRHGLPRLTK